MEKDIFDWEGWDLVETQCMIFYQVVFEKDFGVFKKGEMYEKSTRNIRNLFCSWFCSSPTSKLLATVCLWWGWMSMGNHLSLTGGINF